VKVGRVFSLSLLSKLGVTACLCVAYAAQAQTVTGIITTIAGNGTQGFAGDGGSALNANMNLPFAAVVAGGNLYIADQVNCVVRMVNSSGTISTFAGTAVCGYSGDGGKATAAQLSKIEGIAVDTSGNVYIGDTGNNLVREVSTSGIITTFAGTPGTSGYGGDGGGATGAFLSLPAGLAFDKAGNLYIADTGNNVIRKVAPSTGTTSGTITTYAGSFANGKTYLGDGGPASKAGMYAPVAVAVDTSGNLYIADTNNNVVRKVSTNLIISTLAGNGNPGFSGDGGNPAFAKLSHPNGVTVDSTGNVYIADTLNSRIRLVSPNSTTINTVIGTGQAAYYGDNGPGLQAAVNFPAGLSLDTSGNLIIADTDNSVVRKFVPGGSSGSKPVISAGGVITASQFGGFSTIAPGAWIEIYGSNLASTTTDWSNSFQGINAPTTLGGTTVTIGGLNTYIEYVSPGQVNVQAPLSALNPGTQQMVVSTAAGQSANYSVNVANTAPGLLAQYTVGGKQYVSAFHKDGTLVMPAGAVAGVTSSPAVAGETITLYGVGFGQVNPQRHDGQQVQNPNNSLTTALAIFFGPSQATITYDGLIPPYLGLYQFNVTVPNVASGNLVPLTFILGSSSGAQTLYTAVQ
jgi:uncharacterized protein (TIGR03437 family)